MTWWAAAGGVVERIGGVLVAPRATMVRLLSTREGGLGDATLVLVLRWLAGETRVGGASGDSAMLLGRAVRALGKGDPTQAVQLGLGSLSRLTVDFLAIVVGSVLLALLGGRRSGGRELDLAAMAWVPALVVKVAAALAFTALGREPSAGEERLVDWLALGWASACWAVALWTLREARDRMKA